MDKQGAVGSSREDRRAWWRGHVEGQARSGQSVKAYCTAHGLKSWQWWYWRKALQRSLGGFVELESAGGELRVECGGCQLTLTRGFDPEVLRQVVAVLRAP